MQGYIHSSRKADKVGYITCCSGSCTADIWEFSFGDCDDGLRARLTEKDVTGVAKNHCSPIPPGGIRVKFQSKLGGEENVADDVTGL